MKLVLVTSFGRQSLNVLYRVAEPLQATCDGEAIKSKHDRAHLQGFECPCCVTVGTISFFERFSPSNGYRIKYVDQARVKLFSVFQ